MAWTLARVGEAVVNDPFAEWGYLTPQYQHGIGRHRLARVGAADQAETAKVWFLSNFEPLNGGPWFGFGPGGAGFNQAPFAPEHWAADVILSAEFGGVLSESVLVDVAAEFNAQAPFWVGSAGPPGILFAPNERTSAAERDAAILAAIDHLLSAAQALKIAHGGLGHNRGPLFVDADEIAEICNSAELAKQGVVAKPPDVSGVEGARKHLSDVLHKVSEGVAREIGKKIVDAALDPTLSLLIQLFHTLCHVVSMLGVWLSAILN